MLSVRLRSQPACRVDDQRQVADVGVRQKQMARCAADRSASSVTVFLVQGRCEASKCPHRPFLLRSILKRPFLGPLDIPPIPEEPRRIELAGCALLAVNCRTHYLRNTVGGLGWSIGNADPLRNNACTWRSMIVWGECKKFVEKL